MLFVNVEGDNAVPEHRDVVLGSPRRREQSSYRRDDKYTVTARRLQQTSLKQLLTRAVVSKVEDQLNNVRPGKHHTMRFPAAALTVVVSALWYRSRQKTFREFCSLRLNLGEALSVE